MESKPARDTFLLSLRRCLTETDFVATFYQNFLASNEEIRARFATTDLEKQAEMMKRSLLLCAGATSGDPDSLREVRERAISHDRHHADVRPELYDHWLEALIKSAGEFDPKWDEEIEAAWRRILGFVIRQMIKNY